MEFKIRKASEDDLEVLMNIFSHARHFMKANGNPNQWTDGYPQKELIRMEICKGHCHICEDENSNAVGTFCLIAGPDPTYGIIEDGQWLTNEKYNVIHRLASNGSCKGIAKACIDWCILRDKNLRADTHADNKVMQHILLKNGFIRCGIIYVANGTPRIAYQYGLSK